MIETTSRHVRVFGNVPAGTNDTETIRRVARHAVRNGIAVLVVDTSERKRAPCPLTKRQRERADKAARAEGHDDHDCGVGHAMTTIGEVDNVFRKGGRFRRRKEDGGTPIHERLNIATVPGLSRMVDIDIDSPEQYRDFVQRWADETGDESYLDPKISCLTQITPRAKGRRDVGRITFELTDDEPDYAEVGGSNVAHPEGKWVAYYGTRSYVVAPPSARTKGTYRCVTPAVLGLPRFVHDTIMSHHGSSNGKVRLSRERMALLLGEMTSGDLCRAVDPVREAAIDACTETNRHDSVRDYVLRLVRLGDQGHDGVPEALEDVRAVYVPAVAPDRGGIHVADSEFERMLTGAVGMVTASPTPDADRRCCGSRWTPPDGVDDLWERSDQLRQLAAFARERFLSPAAVLGSVLAVTAVRVGPHVVLPGPPDKASLNVYIGLVGPSGGFKTTTLSAVLNEYAGWGGVPLPAYEVGTGQGITAMYVRSTGNKPPVQYREAALFKLDEIGSLTAHAAQGGANILPTLKTAYSGGQLGAAYADRERRRMIDSHGYRLALVAGIQPRHAGVILDDIDGGFPQRWVWLPARESDAPEESGEYKPGWKLLGQVPVELAAQSDDRDGVRRRREIVLPVAEEVHAEIKVGLRRVAQGKVDELEAHANQTRFKVAALLDVWHDRAQVTAWGWETAGLLMEISDRTREGVIDHLAEAEHAKEQMTSTRLAARAVVSDQARERRQVVDTADWIASKVWAEPERWTAKALRESGTPTRREWFEAGLDHAIAERRVVEVAEPGQGTAARALRPGEVKPS